MVLHFNAIFVDIMSNVSALDAPAGPLSIYIYGVFAYLYLTGQMSLSDLLSLFAAAKNCIWGHFFPLHFQFFVLNLTQHDDAICSKNTNRW